MTTLFTYSTLATLGGAAFATSLLVNVAEQLRPLQRLPSGVLAWGIAIAVLAPAIGFQSGLHLRDMPLLVLNGLLVASTAVGANHVTASHRTRRSSKSG